MDSFVLPLARMHAENGVVHVPGTSSHTTRPSPLRVRVCCSVYIRPRDQKCMHYNVHHIPKCEGRSHAPRRIRRSVACAWLLFFCSLLLEGRRRREWGGRAEVVELQVILLRFFPY